MEAKAHWFVARDGYIVEGISVLVESEMTRDSKVPYHLPHHEYALGAPHLGEVFWGRSSWGFAVQADYPLQPNGIHALLDRKGEFPSFISSKRRKP